MVSCSAVGCGQRSDKRDPYSTSIRRLRNYKVTFHRFPRNPIIRKKWIQATRRDPKWKPNNRSVLCSSHFTEDCFNRTLNVTRLRENAIPTLYPQQPEVIYLDEQPWDEKFLEVSPRRLSNRKTQKMEELLTNDTIVKIKLQLSELLHKTIKTEVKLEPPELIVNGIKNEEEEEIEQKVLLL